MSEHTPEPWWVEDHGDTVWGGERGVKEDCVAWVCGPTKQNARRIVASVNATAGIHTATLEALGEGGLAKLLGELHRNQFGCLLSPPQEPDNA